MNQDISKHPLVVAAEETFRAAGNGLNSALDYLGATDSDDIPRLRVAYSGISSACDALKTASNSLSTTVGHISRMGKSDG